MAWRTELGREGFSPLFALFAIHRFFCNCWLNQTVAIVGGILSLAFASALVDLMILLQIIHLSDGLKWRENCLITPINKKISMFTSDINDHLKLRPPTLTELICNVIQDEVFEIPNKNLSDQFWLFCSNSLKFIWNFREFEFHSKHSVHRWLQLLPSKHCHRQTRTQATLVTDLTRWSRSHAAANAHHENPFDLLNNQSPFSS